jgi:hypothetical protein
VSRTQPPREPDEFRPPRAAAAFSGVGGRLSDVVEVGPPVISTSLPATWEDRAAELHRLLCGVSHAKATHTETHAKAYLEADGPETRREQTARLAAARSQLLLDEARAELEAFRLLLTPALIVPPEPGADGR